MNLNSALKAAATALAVATVGFGVAACGGASKAAGVITAPGVGATTESATATAATTATTAASTVTTPTSGKLATEPVPSKPSGAAPTKLVVKTLVQGTGTAAASGDDITVNFLGYNYATGKPFSGGSSWTSTTVATPYGPIQLGAGAVIKGWDEGLVGVKAGSRVELIIPPSLAYKSDPSSPLHNDTLVFVIDVLQVTPG